MGMIGGGLLVGVRGAGGEGAKGDGGGAVVGLGNPLK